MTLLENALLQHYFFAMSKSAGADWRYEKPDGPAT